MKQSVLTSTYMRDNRKFADVCNYLIYNGKTVIKPEDLQEMDVTVLGVIYTDKGQREVEKIRDIFKACVIKQANGITYLLLGIENQANIHYAMVVRNMVQDSLNYSAQVDAIAKEHRKNQDLTESGEYLSGFAKSDKLNPVITITVLWNTGPWDAPRTLHEMLNTTDKEILKFVPDYHLNLIVPEEIQDFDRFETELGIVLNWFQCANNKKELQKLAQRKESILLDRESVMLLNECLNTGIKLPEKEGQVIDMCKGMMEWAEDERREGREEGREEGRFQILISLTNEGYITKEVAADKLGVAVNDFEKMLVGAEESK